MKDPLLSNLSSYFKSNPLVILAIIFGSQVTSKARYDSDFDLALLIRQNNEYKRLGIKETIRNDISKVLGISTEKVDIVDIANAGLAITSTIVSQGKVLKGEGTLELSHFYIRTWALEEDFNMRLNHGF